MQRRAVYPGTFDPITRGHEDVARRAAALFDELVIGVAVANHKKTFFDLAQRMALAREVLQDLPHVRVVPLSGLLMAFCQQHQAQAVVRGVRNLTDFDYEAQMAAMNRMLRPEVETVLLLPTASLQCISSTLVREVAKLGGALDALVSPPVAAALGACKGQV